MDHHLGHDDQVGNNRNGYGRKTVTTDSGRIEIEVPRDRAGSFDPQLIAKYQRRFPGFDDKIISMYARGMSTREITGHLRELYGIDASPDLISTITDAVLEEVAAWQQRPLDPAYPLVFLRCDPGQDPRRGDGPQQGDPYCSGRHGRRHQGGAGAVAGAE
ncbi:transposase [Novosphingobium colocasiae]